MTMNDQAVEVRHGEEAARLLQVASDESTPTVIRMPGLEFVIPPPASEHRRPGDPATPEGCRSLASTHAMLQLAESNDVLARKGQAHREFDQILFDGDAIDFERVRAGIQRRVGRGWRFGRG